jgi:hypothetical protein
LSAAGRITSTATSAAIASGGNPYITAGAAALQLGVEISNAIDRGRAGWEKLADAVSDRFAGIGQIISDSIAAGFSSREIKQAVDQFVRTLVTQITIARIVETALSQDFKDLEEAVEAGESTEAIIARIVEKTPGLVTQATAAAGAINRNALVIDPPAKGRLGRADDRRRAQPGEAGRTGGLTVTTISGGFRDVLQSLGNRRDNLLTEIRDGIRALSGGGGMEFAGEGAGGLGGTVINIDTVQVQQVADIEGLGAVVQDQFNVGMGREFAKAKKRRGR